LSDLAEALLCFIAFPPGYQGLPRSNSGRCQQCQDDHAARDHSHAMAFRELSKSVRERICGRRYGQAFEMAANIFGKLVNRLITPLGFLGEGFQDYVVDVAEK